MDLKVVVITGITSALGKGIFLRLVNEFPAIKIYGTARSSKRAGDSFNSFIENNNELTKRIENKDLILIPAELDTMDLKKVQAFSQLLHQEKKIDFLLLNAGTIISNGLYWSAAALQLFTDTRGFPVKPNYIKHDGKSCTPDGISKSFSTNVYGHYLLTESLQDLLASSADARVVWVGSSEGEQRFFDSSDLEGRNSINPYGSNKFCLHIISQFLNKRYRKHKLTISSTVAAPGILPSNIAASMVPSIFIPFLVPFFWTLRFLLGIEEFTIDAHSAAEAIMYAVTTPLGQLHIEKRADSVCSRLGAPSVCLTSIPCINEDLETKLFEYLTNLNLKFGIQFNTIAT